MKLKFEDPHLTAVFNTPPGERMPKRVGFTAKSGRIKKARSFEADLVTGYIMMGIGGSTLICSPALMEMAEAAGSGDAKWLIPGISTLIVGLGLKRFFG